MLASVREAGLPIARADLLSAFLARAAQTRHALLVLHIGRIYLARATENNDAGQPAVAQSVRGFSCC